MMHFLFRCLSCAAHCFPEKVSGKGPNRRNKTIQRSVAHSQTRVFSSSGIGLRSFSSIPWKLGQENSQNHFPTSKKTPFRKRKDTLFTCLNFTMIVDSPRDSDQRAARLFSSQRNDLLYGRRWTKQMGVIPNVNLSTGLAFRDRTVLENPPYCTCWPPSHTWTTGLCSTL